jgi:hypothetical protein
MFFDLVPRKFINTTRIINFQSADAEKFILPKDWNLSAENFSFLYDEFGRI